MGVGQASSKPCRLCGEHKQNIVEPVRLFTTCTDCRHYETRFGRLMIYIGAIDQARMENAEYVKGLLEVLDVSTIHETQEITLRYVRG